MPGAFSADDAIVVTAIRNPVDKSYPRMVRGMDLFDRRHAMAPHATLRYRLLPRKRTTNMSGIDMRIVADTFEIPVPVASDGTFVLERNPQALREKASVRPNRKAETMTWRADVRTPGLPAGTRRLGDLRLECRVGMEAGLVSQYPSLMGRLLDALPDGPALCEQRDAPYLFFADRPLFAVTLRAGARKETLSVDQLYAGTAHGLAPREDLNHCDCEVLLDRAYYLPLGDQSWPDDTVVELDYMDTPGRDANDAILAGAAKNEVVAMLGKPAVARFDSGFEVWAWQYGAEKRRYGRTELVVLVNPSGTVAKTRLRPAPA